jgi:hypothetical protein
MLNRFVLAAGLSITLVSPMCFGWGLPALPGVPALGSGSGSSTGAAGVDKFLADGKASTKLINDSRNLLVEAILTKEERAARQAKLDQINTGLAANDKKADEALKQSEADDTAKLLAATNDKAEQDRLQHLSSAQKKAVVGAFANLTFGVLLQTQQLKTGQDLLQSASGRKHGACNQIART